MGIRRILVAVDASPLSLAALAAAARLAERLGAALDALFVEDINVVRLSAHPYVHTFSLSAARRQALDDTVIEKAVQLQAVAARRALEEELARGTAQGSFAVRRGRVAALLLEAAHHADLVCLGWSGKATPGPRPRLGSVARRLVEAARPPVLLLQKPHGGAVMALWDGSEPARQALRIAAQLATRDGGAVELLIPAADPAPLVEEAAALLVPTGMAVNLRACGPLARCLAKADPDGLLVAAAGLALDDLPCSVVVVR